MKNIVKPFNFYSSLNSQSLVSLQPPFLHATNIRLVPIHAISSLLTRHIGSSEGSRPLSFINTDKDIITIILTNPWQYWNGLKFVLRLIVQNDPYIVHSRCWENEHFWVVHIDRGNYVKHINRPPYKNYTVSFSDEVPYIWDTDPIIP